MQRSPLFVCSDYVLRTAAKERLARIERFSTFESLNDFRSFIQLTQKDLTESFVRSILDRACEKFYKKGSKEGLFCKDGFMDKLRNEFGTKLETPSPSEGLAALFRNPQTPDAPAWKPIGAERCWVARPQFLRFEGRCTHHWPSAVTFVRMFASPTRTIPQLTGIGQSEEARLMVLRIDVRWRSNVRKDGRFYDNKITDHEERSYSFAPPTDAERERYSLE